MISKVFNKIKELLTSGISTVLILLLCFGGIFGVIISYKQDDVIAIVLSLLVPGYGAVLLIGQVLKYFGM